MLRPPPDGRAVPTRAPVAEWPDNPGGTTEWVEYAFEKPATVSEAQVYWFEETGHADVRVPASWHLLYRDGRQWKAVDAHGTYGVENDRFNTVTFMPVTTSGLRLEVTLQPEWSAGLQEWRVR